MPCHGKWHYHALAPIGIMTLEELTTLEKLNNAFLKSARASHWKESTQKYKVNLIQRNLELQEELRNGTYKVSRTNNFTLNERGKLRNIKAPAMRDRVVQKVLCEEILVPQLSRYLIYDNYASLTGRGTSLARKRLQIMLDNYLKEHGDDGYVLQIDIQKYFDSIDHAILKEMVHKRIHEPEDVMDLIDYTIDTSSDSDVGLNLGAEAPQIFSVFYPCEVDNYIKTVKGIKVYGRYADDMIIISDSKEELKELLADIEEQLTALKLTINRKKTHITPLKHGFTYLQIKYNVVDGKILKRPTHKKIARERRRLRKFKRKYDEGKMSEYDIHNCYRSWRNTILKDCNACKKTIQSMDRLYTELFPNNEVYNKTTRSEIIKEAFKNDEARQYIYSILDY